MSENLKNVLLVMITNDYLVPPSRDPSKEKLWTETWKRIDRFLPELKKELPVKEAPAAAAAAPAQEVAEKAAA